ncbi:MAG: Uma2 family endonuclease, partial [Deltaproteobacteria bacterium]|nr:Uma2 family endonuclease [Deltaproteobacteria bacterium]
SRPPRGFVVLDGGKIDWSQWYLTDEEDMGQSPEQFMTIQRLVSAARALGRERGWSHDRLLIGADCYFGWVEREPLVRVSPDVFLLDDPPPRPYPKSFQTWRAGHRPPRFAVEVVSEKWTKDYDDAPDKYAQLGTRELVIFDAETSPKANPRRERLQVFRRDEVGALARVYAGPGPAWSEELQIWLVADQVDGAWELALARDAEGLELVPTESELAELEAQRAETEKQRAETEKQRAETEKQRAETEKQRAETEKQRAEVMAAKLRALGIDPTQL